jgi:hypothetical protein
MQVRTISVASLYNVLTGVLLLTPLAGAADPALLDFIMPDARVVVGMDIAHMRSSPLNTSVTNSVQSANPELKKLMEAAGFDPMRDLQEILFASPGIGKNPPALLVARGSFDVAKLRAFAESAGSKITDFGGVPILSDPEKDSGAFALLDNIILAGNPEQVRAAIGRRGHGLILNTEMATRISSLSRRYDAWLVSLAPLATMASNLPPDANVEGLTNTEALRQIEQFSLGVGMGSDLTFAAELVMANAKAAGSIADGIQMMLGMAQQSAKDEPALASALKNLNFGVDQNVVHLGVTVSVADVEKVVQTAMNSQMKKAAGPMTATKQEPRIQMHAPELTIQKAEADAQPQPDAPAVAERIDPAPAVAIAAVPQPPAPKLAGSAARSARIPANGEILIQSSPKDMGTVVIMGSKK